MTESEISDSGAMRVRGVSADADPGGGLLLWSVLVGVESDLAVHREQQDAARGVAQLGLQSQDSSRDGHGYTGRNHCQ